MNEATSDGLAGLGGPRPDAWHSPAVDDLFDESLHLYEVYHAQSNMTIRMEAEIGARFADLYASTNLNRMVAEGSGTNASLPKVYLPSPARSKRNYTDVIANRRTVREFASDVMALDDIAAVLWSSFGITAQERDANGTVHSLRALPSGGALYPLEAYLVPFQVGGLAADIVYRYNPVEHALEITRYSLGRDQLGACLNGVYPKTWRSASAVVVVSSIFNRMTFKYGERGYRFVLFEAGAACSQMCLAATSLELGACWVGGYYDDEVNRMVGVDGVDHAALGIVLLGGLARSTDEPGTTHE